MFRWRTQKLLAIVVAVFIAAGFANAQEKTLTVPILTDPGTMNPIMMSSTAEVIMGRLLFDGLTILDPETFEPLPHLAKSWDVSEDGLEWTFHLNDNIYWHDGVQFTSDDVKFTFDMVLDPEVGAPARANFLLVESVDTPDPLTAVINLSSPWAAMPNFLSNRIQMAPKHLLEGEDQDRFVEYNKFNPVGTGPYKMVRNEVADYIELEGFDDYFLGKPDIDRLFVKVLPDGNTQIAQLRTGELDFIQLEYPQLNAIQNVRGIRIETGDRSLWYALHLNNQHELFNDPVVRRAIAHAIDRDLLIDAVLMGYAVPATGPIIPAIEPYYTDDVATYDYDPEKALELLAEAGWEPGPGGVLHKDGKPFTFELSVIQGDATAERSSTIIHQNLKAIGLDPVMKAYEFSTFITDVRDARVGDKMSEAYFVWMTPVADPDGIYAYFHSSNGLSGSNFTVYENPLVDELLERGRVTVDVDERVEIYHEIQRLIAEDVPRVFLAYPQSLMALRDRVEGVEVSDPWTWSHTWRVND